MKGLASLGVKRNGLKRFLILMNRDASVAPPHRQGLDKNAYEDRATKVLSFLDIDLAAHIDALNEA